MDFLDPRKRRSHRTRLMVGYGLVGIAIALATTILVYAAYGYSIDTKTGNIVQNGLLFVDSRPGGAQIHLNGGRYQNATTAARLVLPSGEYELALKKDGYRDWQRKFLLEEHSIARYVYPFLFPDKPVSTSLKTYSQAPPLMSQSPDRRWLLVQAPPTGGPVIFDEIDTANPRDPARRVSLPTALLSLPLGTLTEVEWSTDNNHLLLKNTHASGSEFLILDRRQPAQSVNLNRQFRLNPAQVLLRNKRADRVYLFDQAARTVRLGVVDSGNLEPVLLNQVLAFKPYGPNLISYVTDRQAPAGQAAVHIWDNGTAYHLTTLTAGETYLLDAAQFQGTWYYVTGSNTSDRVNIFKDPLSDLKDTRVGKAVPSRTLRITGGAFVKFSHNTRFAAVQAGQQFAVYDFEEDDSYIYELPVPLSGPMHWMDGHRLIGASDGQAIVIDYDATNRQALTTTLLAAGGYFSSNYNYLFTLTPLPGGAGFRLDNVDMRAGEDLPANPSER